MNKLVQIGWTELRHVGDTYQRVFVEAFWNGLSWTFSERSSWDNTWHNATATITQLMIADYASRAIAAGSLHLGEEICLALVDEVVVSHLIVCQAANSSGLPFTSVRLRWLSETPMSGAATVSKQTNRPLRTEDLTKGPRFEFERMAPKARGSHAPSFGLLPRAVKAFLGKVRKEEYPVKFWRMLEIADPIVMGLVFLVMATVLASLIENAWLTYFAVAVTATLVAAMLRNSRDGV
jgi:uncharacterized membrane protein